MRRDRLRGLSHVLQDNILFFSNYKGNVHIPGKQRLHRYDMITRKQHFTGEVSEAGLDLSIAAGCRGLLLLENRSPPGDRLHDRPGYIAHRACLFRHIEGIRVDGQNRLKKFSQIPSSAHDIQLSHRTRFACPGKSGHSMALFPHR